MDLLVPGLITGVSKTGHFLVPGRFLVNLVLVYLYLSCYCTALMKAQLNLAGAKLGSALVWLLFY